ncbi:SpoIIE family protein phosphatase [Thioflexithrix psekupsensis]|uniref:HAMP domain-containing protein n=1 Tax=Thioflexithrix psekupsensis TaxID=1570016 RepID=A0A251XD84_9GAMM|nr:SpoIIE family protein phosphatase [Thioflexithrix psekupsensis]OUD16335.1 hypothetical protein TPSD3_00475 [Thioflexithrix psekupsensis]
MIFTAYQSGFIHGFNRIPLRYLLIIPFIFLLLLTVAIVSWLSWNNSQVAVNHLAKKLRESVSIRIEDHLIRSLERPTIVNKKMQNAIDLSWLEPEQLDVLQSYFFKQLQLFERMSYVQFAHRNGDFLGLERHPKGHFSLDIANADTMGDMESYSLDSSGIKGKVPLFFVPGYDARQQIWYQNTQQSQSSRWQIQVGKSNWNDVFSFFGQTWLSITYSTPIFKQGEFIGVAAVDFTLTDLSQFLHQLNFSPNGQTFIIERSGKLLASSSQEKLYSLRLIDKTIERLMATESEQLLIRETAQYLQQYFGDFSRIDRNNQLEFNIEKKRQYVQILPFKLDKDLDWLIVVVVPESDFMAEIDANTKTTVQLSIVALCLALLLGIAISYWVIYPIRALNQAANQLASGEWTQIPVMRYDELGKLTKTFNLMAKQLQESFVQLEEKVAERTAHITAQANQLAEANHKIHLLNEKLHADNRRMGAELSVTRRLQQMVLPRKEELNAIETLEIASFMEPATEVGGDYYDILQIGIGDVTGHGLESGVLMMMVQTAVRALLSSDIEDPKKFLTILNRTLYDNLQRMQSDKNLTLALIDYYEGKLRLSGQHEEVLFVRRSGEIERIDTFSLGFMVGLEPDIADFVTYRELDLLEGDGIVLYTDGLTEAMNAQRQQYGVGRLCETVSRHWHLNAQQIQQIVINDLRRHIGSHRLQDDVTLLIIKQKVLTVAAAA